MKKETKDRAKLAVGRNTVRDNKKKDDNTKD